MTSAFAAFYRQDFELILVRFAPDVVYELDPGLQTLGLAGTFRGHEGMLEAFGKLTEAWESWQLEPAYIIDLGDRVLFLGFNRSRARGSGVQLEEEYAQLVTLPDGVVTHFQAFFSWEECLRAAGVDPAALTLPARGKPGKAASAVA
jgi:ketosteroid isomerase-like protein